jgi:alkylmercury lyase
VLLRRADSRPGLIAKWSTELDPSQDLVWRTVLELFGHLGRAPLLMEIAREAGLRETELPTVLRALHARDLLGIDETRRAIVHAYPFTERDTGHRVDLLGQRLNALCAIDALGVGAMYRSDVALQSACQWCRTPIQIATTERGRALSATSPIGSVVWYDYAYDQSAAASCCPMITFFCGDDHLRQWLARQVPARAGCRLTPDEALEVGRAIFEPVLRKPSATTLPYAH